MGYKKIVTYTLKTESGASLRAAGYTSNENVGGGSDWNVPSRPREVVQETFFGTVEKYPVGKKIRWEKVFK